ncbi:class I SAM-dependent methyltransferase [Amycolatopsis pithecellobii]|uniref:Methyltransferase domain-containing protein n=1 Tax=Amycolatopsis pithecellobii TaxID=664692 RepID=A0A6N7Z193_9PSEU|nr:class I SAM-dependent methyltransferase [Amycolatopsis pithecellobii]MTD54539.1 methyltransferase domain-containing protein [Amycolatopsis pithecellobii]
MTDNVTEAGSYSTGSLTRDQLSPLDQLRLFERKYDPQTRDIIERLPLTPAARCLELGAGAGSMARWLAARTPEGGVLAVDVDTRHLEDSAAPNLTVQQADITQTQFPPDTYDLVLARAVLEHLAEPDDLLAKAKRWLAPGGWLIVEDFYYLPASDAPTAVGRVLVEAYVRRMLAQGADLRWARRMPAALARAGLESVEMRIMPAGPGQSAADTELIGTRMRQEGHTLVDSGLVTADQLAEFLDLLGRPEGRDMTTLAVSAWGRRPEQP